MVNRARCAPACAVALLCVGLGANGLHTFQPDPLTQPGDMPLLINTRGTPDPLVCGMDVRTDTEGTNQASMMREPECPPRNNTPIQCDTDEWPLIQQAKDFWTDEHCPLEPINVEKAGKPEGHTGARLRLRRAMRKLADTGSLNISVIGTSMTVGWAAHRAWPVRLQDLFRHRGYNVSVYNMARGGSTSRWALTDFYALKLFFGHADIVLIDYELNDRAENKDFRSDDPVEAIQMYYRDLVLMTLGLPNKPAVVDILTFTETFVEAFSRSEGLERPETEAFVGESGVDQPTYGESYIPTNDCAAIDVKKFHHWPVNVDLQVPMISYTHCVCAAGTRTFWTKESSLHDSPGTPHPGDMTHDLVARIIYGVLLQEMDKACSKDADAAEDMSDVKQASDVAKCLASPGSAFDAKNGEDKFAPIQRDGAWNFWADSKDKYGWISRPDKKGFGNITFEIETTTGWIQIEYLGTYANIGHVTVWVDREKQELQGNRKCLLNGLWPDLVSLSRFSLMKTNLPAGRHNLTFQSYGQKFKLLGITTC